MRFDVSLHLSKAPRILQGSPSPTPPFGGCLSTPGPPPPKKASRLTSRLVHSTIQAGLGASLGAVARYSLGLLIPHAWLLLAINATGCFAIARLKPSPFWTVGLLGGFTSYSAIQATESPTLFAVMMAVCLASYWTGSKFCRN